jgi:hypothetical protein
MIWHAKCFMHVPYGRNGMYRPIASAALLAISLTWCFSGVASRSAFAQAGQKQEQKKAPTKSKAGSASMTGCVDEHEGQYVLIDDRTRDPIANLEAEGFETEGFAKHVGHKVTVRGTSNPSGARPTFRVRTIETVSETCGPQSEQ